MVVVKLVARRLIAAVLLLLVLSLLTYALLALSPGGPERALLGDRPATPETIAAIRAQFLLDEPFPVRYWHWLSQALTGDFGTSITVRQPVISMLSERVNVTVTLALLAAVVTLAVGIPAGLAAGIRRGGRLDRSITLVSLVFLSFPPFAIALVLLYGFAIQLRWFPVYGTGDLSHYVLPAIALALGPAAVLTRHTRAAALQVGEQDYITFARARGLSRFGIWESYLLRNSALPVLTIAGLIIAGYLTGAVFVEQAFSLPGLGSLLVQSVTQKDIPVVQALVLLSGVVVIVANLLVDVAYVIVNPQIRQGRA
ncbi:ABC transporter permease [Agromyces italicus]|uniref:ABC transporter permease n=1 Tax=Agromyces italicus TaxID=279572 RepID=UPI0003B7B007|nr:ABC transporter permease [Agromyces italicus]